jgi:hypothetical protein
MTCSADTTWSIEYSAFDTIEPGETKGLSLTPSNPADNPGAGGSGPCGATNAGVASNVVFYLGGNPTDVQSYNYSVKLKPVGWFGEYDQPTDRFEKTLTFHTQ